MAVEKLLSEWDYLAWERGQDEKHELINGVVVAMAGASTPHNMVQDNLVVALGSQLRPLGCRTLGSDQRVRVNDLNYFYPDLTIVCGRPEVYDEDLLLNPLVVFEIHSDSTRRRDRTFKLLQYQRIESLRHIVFVEPHEYRVERCTRGDRYWDWAEFVGPDAVLDLDPPGARVPLPELYQGVLVAP